MLRTAKVEDAKEIAQIHIDAWRAAYQNIVPQKHLDSLSVDDRTKSWQNQITEAVFSVLVLEVENKIVGWIAFGQNRDKENGHEISAIYVAPQFWGKGIGTILLKKAEEILLSMELGDIILWVLEKNTSSIKFYQKMGFEKDNTKKQKVIGGKDLTIIRMKKSPI